MDLDGDARVSEQEFQDAIKIALPFSKAGYRRTTKMQKTLVEQSLGPHFANSIRKSGSRHDSLDVINEKHSLGRQFQPKSKLMVPNCSTILPKRYKKDWEDRFVTAQPPEDSKSNNKQVFIPAGGHVSIEKMTTPNYAGRQRCRSGSTVNSRTFQRHARGMESIRERSAEINRA